MGIRAVTPCVDCPSCGSNDIYAGTILDDSNGTGERTIGAVRCNNCNFEIQDSWEPNLGEDYDRERLGALVGKWKIVATLTEVFYGKRDKEGDNHANGQQEHG